MAVVDWALAIAIIIGFILVVWAKVSNETIPELLRNLKDLILDTKEDVSEDITYGYLEK